MSRSTSVPSTAHQGGKLENDWRVRASLGTECLSTSVPSPAQGGKLDSDLRYLSLSAFLWQPSQQQQQPQQPLPPPPPQQQQRRQQRQEEEEHQQQPCASLVFAVAAASDASLALLCADLSTCPRELGGGRRPQQWRPAATLQHHTCPVLCTAHCRLGPDGGGDQPRQVVCSGATDGAVAVWDVTAAAAAAAAGSGDPGGAGQQPAVLAPLLVLPGVHQSGVNALAAVAAGEAHRRIQRGHGLLRHTALIGCARLKCAGR